jgi:histidinol-phosphatase
VSDWSADLAFAQHLADIADEISMRFFRDARTSVRTKTDGTPVTEADEAIERRLRDEIGSAFPDDSVYGEEEGRAEGTSGRRWIIDPIDGTKPFSWGIRNWATLISLETGDDIVCGVASAPAVGDRYWAARGTGAVRNGKPIRVSEVTDLKDARIGYTAIHAFTREVPLLQEFLGLVDIAAADRGIGDFLGHMLVAQGSLDVMVEPLLNPWDIGAVIVIVQEAGGRMTDLEGTAHVWGGSGVSSNGPLHEAVLEAMRPA